MLESLIYLERYRNEGTRTYSPHAQHNEAEERYQPRATEKGFGLRAFAVPREDVLVFLANPPSELENTYLPGDEALFCVHPQVLAHKPNDPHLIALLKQSRTKADIPVIPSASTRTLYVLDKFPHALKVHFPFRVSRYERKMRCEVIEQALAVSLELEQGLAAAPKDFAFMREVIGIVSKEIKERDERGENWGYLVRDLHPWPLVAEKRRLVPGFALYGRDFFDYSKTPLLWELMGREEAISFVVERIMLPIIRHWLWCYLRFGFIMEPHGQNVLLELDAEGAITRIVHRDLSVGIDMRRRRDLGLNSSHLNTYNRMEDGIFLSIAYDKFMGNHFFERLIACCQERQPQLMAEDFRIPCRTLFAEQFTDYSRYFPESVQYFSEKRDRYNKPFFLDTGKKPFWRP